MKTLLLTLSLIIISPTLFSQSITIGGDGIVRCKDVAIGTTEIIDEVTYEVVDRALLEQRRDEGADLTKSCVSNVTNMSDLFQNITDFNQAIGNWDVSFVTTMYAIFQQAESFNQDIGNWDVSNVKEMTRMFMNAYSFNQDISNWNVSSVTSMSQMFNGASSFNQDIGNWDVSSVTNMHYTFANSSFDQDISKWNVSSVSSMQGMFRGNIYFNQDIGNWDLSSNYQTSLMFYGAISFNQDIGNWDVSRVMDTDFMFNGASSFNQDIGNWDVSNMDGMRYMFNGATSFNQDLSKWDVSNVSEMDNMFSYATAFNGNISSWDISKVSNLYAMFYQAASFDQDIGNWDVSNVTNMTGMFYGASAFNQDLSKWDVSSAISMYYMFAYASEFNGDIGSWDVSNVETMRSMFWGAISFNQNIGSWDISNVVTLDGFLGYTTSFNQDLSSYCVSQFPTEPKTFSLESAIENKNKPIWGTCPKSPDKIKLSSPKDSTMNLDISQKFTWEKDSLSTHYQFILTDLSDSTKFDTLGAFNNINNLIVTDKFHLRNSTSYIWKVRGINEEYNRIGDWSEVWSFTTIDVPLASPLLSTPFNEQVNVGTLTEFTWNEVESSVSYYLQVSTDDQFSSTVFDSLKVGSSSFTLTEPLSENTTYFWRMKSISDYELRNSEWSDTFTFTTGVRTSIEDELIPQDYQLSQNYPNPFNPSTQIQYALPEATEVSLEVFNSVGQKVMELVNGLQSAGYHTATFDASGLSSGVYLYKLTTPSFTETKKMLLIK